MNSTILKNNVINNVVFHILKFIFKQLEIPIILSFPIAPTIETEI